MIGIITKGKERKWQKKEKIKSLLTEKEKEVCYRYKHYEDCLKFEKYYYYGICYYVYFKEIKVNENEKV